MTLDKKFFDATKNQTKINQMKYKFQQTNPKIFKPKPNPVTIHNSKLYLHPTSAHPILQLTPLNIFPNKNDSLPRHVNRRKCTTLLPLLAKIRRLLSSRGRPRSNVP